MRKFSSSSLVVPVLCRESPAKEALRTMAFLAWAISEVVFQRVTGDETGRDCFVSAVSSDITEPSSRTGTVAMVLCFSVGW